MKPCGHAHIARTRPIRAYHNPQTQAIIYFCGKIGWFLVSSSKTTHFERKRWAPPFKPCPRGVHWWWSRPNWLSWRRETWLGPRKSAIWDPSGWRAKIAHVALKSSWEPHGPTEGLTFLSRLLSSKIELRRVFPGILGDCLSLWVVQS